MELAGLLLLVLVLVLVLLSGEAASGRERLVLHYHQVQGLHEDVSRFSSSNNCQLM